MTGSCAGGRPNSFPYFFVWSPERRFDGYPGAIHVPGKTPPRSTIRRILYARSLNSYPNAGATTIATSLLLLGIRRRVATRKVRFPPKADEQCNSQQNLPRPKFQTNLEDFKIAGMYPLKRTIERGTRSPYSDPIRAPFSATERFISSTTNTSATMTTASTQNTSK